MSFFEQIATNVLTDLYSYFFSAVLFALLLLVVVLFAREKGWRYVIEKFVKVLRNDKLFRRLLIFLTYLGMVLFRTLLNRRLWQNNIENIMGCWKLYDSTGNIYTENIENMILFIPLSFLFMFAFSAEVKKYPTHKRYLLYIGITLGVSTLIEMAQLFFRLGEIQLSDLFFNTLGGLLGLGVYFIGCKVLEVVKKFKEGKHQ